MPIATILTILNLLDKAVSVGERGVSVGEKVVRAYNWFTGVSSGDQMTQSIQTVERARSKIIRLSDNVLYAPDLQQAISHDGTTRFQDQKRVHDMVHPLAEALDTQVLSSAIVSTPDLLQKAFGKNPWEVLIDIRPAGRTTPPNNPDLVPISFFDGNIQYIGWQTRGALPSLFNCEFETQGSLLVPAKKSQPAQKKSPPAMPIQPIAAPPTQRTPPTMPTHYIPPPAPPKAVANTFEEQLRRWVKGYAVRLPMDDPNDQMLNTYRQYFPGDKGRRASALNPYDAPLGLVGCSNRCFLAMGIRGIYFKNSIVTGSKRLVMPKGEIRYLGLASQPIALKEDEQSISIGFFGAFWYDNDLRPYAKTIAELLKGLQVIAKERTTFRFDPKLFGPQK